MCEICLRSPCHVRCPNAPEPIPVFICAECGNDIHDGEDYYEVLGEQFCEHCIDNAKGVAEHDPD